MRDVKWIVVHCTATKQSATVESILRYWREKLGWKSPGYQRIIEANGKVHILAPDEKIANGVHGYNKISLHVSYIGGIDKDGKPLDNRTEAQKRALADILLEWRMKHPKAKIVGHNNLNPEKACPSFAADKEYGWI